MHDSRYRIKESFLLHIWDEGHLSLDRLVTTSGQRIEVLFRGRWNVDAGPDFLNAILKIGGKLYKGDIEVHFNCEDWLAHGHHLDPRYNRVILHVVFQHSGSTQTFTAEGKSVPILVMSDFLDESISRLRSKISVSPNRPTTKWPDYCHLAQKPTQDKMRVLQHWGLERFAVKKERFREERNYFELNELLYQGLCEALGYSKNRTPFLKLSFRVPVRQAWALVQNSSTQDEALLQLQGLYFGMAGLLPEEKDLPLEISRFVNRLRFYWHLADSNAPQRSMNPEEWQFFRLRPNNFPTVRLAGLCKLVWLRRKTGFLDPILATFRDLAHTPEKIFPELERQFWVTSYGLWRKYFHFNQDLEYSTVPGRLNLIGKGKSREIVINVILPIAELYAEETEDLELSGLIKLVYLKAPKLESNRYTRKLQLQLKLRRDELRMVRACHQQGMIHLARQMCPNWFCSECYEPIQ